MTQTQDILWAVGFSKKAGKQKSRLPQNVLDRLAALVKELILEGPVQHEWLNYGKLKGKKGDYHHCHVHGGHPTYVVVWQVLDRQVRIMEIRYAGTHENLNYDSFK
jgi:mRNA-degrading endonuclease RelE of RelBE toxin-antitoxin system